jgi:hypothetical protein
MSVCQNKALHFITNDESLDIIYIIFRTCNSVNSVNSV